MDERACMSKQLKWNKFPFYGDRMTGKSVQGEIISQIARQRV